MPNYNLIQVCTNFPMSLFAPKTELSIKIYDGLIKLQSSFHIQFPKNFIKMYYNLYQGTLRLVEI
jgi:hypothetical protein